MQPSSGPWRLLVLVGLLLSCLAPGCRSASASLTVTAEQTFAELRAIKGSVVVTPLGAAGRPPYPRERLAEGTVVTLAAGALAWVRRDTGAVALVDGPARLTMKADSAELTQGRAFVDTAGGPAAHLDTPGGPIELSDARASVEIAADGTVTTYVLRGSARSGERAGAGELLTLHAGAPPRRAPAAAWDDWTGGLATADSDAEPAPFGVGTVGARPPGDQGKPRFSLVVQRLDVRVTIDHELAITEVDETFVNPTSNVVEGIFSFRAPPRAVLQRFGVDRNGDLVWGRVKESAAALAQYESNVYAGSTEDPALLQWVSPGVYSARLYPIPPGAQRRVVTRYTEWLAREGPQGDRRLYVYPMAAEGARGSLPRIEELTVTLDLARAGATHVRSGMRGKRDGQSVVIQAFDVVPLADLSVELFDAGQTTPVAYRAPHGLTADDAPEQAEPGFASKVSGEEPDYLLVPLRSPRPTAAVDGIDLALVVDTSAATETGALGVARSLASALLAHLGPGDRAALWAGDAKLHPVVEGSGALTTLDDARRRTWLDGLASIDRGGATDIGALLTEAAGTLDPKRLGAVVYIGDGQPSVGEIAPKALHERLARMPSGTRIFTAALGSNANTAMLASITRGAPVEVVSDAYGAARAALRLLEAAYHSTWVGASIELGPGIERVLPHELPAIASDEATLVVGRVTGKPPAELTLRSGDQVSTQPLFVQSLEDYGDLRRRWGEQRVAELVEQGAGRASIVDVGRRYGLVSPFTSLYVPTTREMATEAPVDAELADRRDERRDRWKPWKRTASMILADMAPASAEDNKEGGTGTRAKGEEGSMGNPNNKPTAGARYGMQGPVVAAPPPAEAAEFGMIGLLGGNGDKDGNGAFRGGSPAPAAAPPAMRAPTSPGPGAAARPMPTAAASATTATGSAWGSNIGDATAAGGLGLSGIGQGGGGAGQGIGMAGIIGHGHAKQGADDQEREKKSKTGDLARDQGGQAGGNVNGWLAGQSVAPQVLATVDHAPRPCSAGADLSFDERRVLWNERLAAVTSATQALDVYHRALGGCEAPTWRERHTLLLAMVSRLPTVRERVALWRQLLDSPASADVVYRAIVVRVQTAADLKALHDALGLHAIDPDLLAGMLAKAKTPDARLSLLRAASLKWPDDLELSLRVLDGYDDLGDDGGGRAWARRLRHRADATAHVYTSVGEYYLRLSQRESGAPAARDADEARRTFGELVEFAPDDPAARRRLGDLLRAHSWYDEAFRQYETLAQLTPDDPTVPLLLASAAQGMGRIEEAVSWAEKAGATAAPDGTSPLSKAARATASAFLAWAQDDATRAGKKDDADKLRARAKRLAGTDGAPEGSVRVLVTWAHPELRPVLWTSTLGAPMPAVDNFPLFGVAEAVLPLGAAAIELRLEPEDAARAARLGAHAIVTVLVGEGTASEKIARQDVAFGDALHPRADVKVTFDGTTLHVEAP